MGYQTIEYLRLNMHLCKQPLFRRSSTTVGGAHPSKEKASGVGAKSFDPAFRILSKQNDPGTTLTVPGSQCTQSFSSLGRFQRAFFQLLQRIMRNVESEGKKTAREVENAAIETRLQQQLRALRECVKP